MSDAALQSPFDALRKSFVLSEQPQPQQAVATTDKRVRGHAFSIGTFHLVVDTVRYPCEVYEELPLCRLPGSPAHLAGMANQRGNIVPIFDIHTLLGYRQEGGHDYYLIIGSRDDAVGFRISQLPRRIELAPEERITTALPIPRLLEPHIRQFFQQNEQIFADWDVQGFLASLASEA
ncbi:MAG TPA: chemotaxis protein CheW [Gammaproteobacteria bacterium]